MILKRLVITLALVAGLVSPVHAAGTISFSLSQQFDSLGKPLSGCKLYFYMAGTVATPQNAYQDTNLTIPQPNPMTCDAAGRLGQFFLADGQIKIRLTNAAGVDQVVADNILVIGPSSGGGGGGSVDPTTILATGDLKASYGTDVLAGWVRANGRTIGSATSGATERANADCQALFQYLWGADANLAVSGGRGASAAADWAANKTIVLPDLRGRVIAGLDNMGNTNAGRLTGSFFGPNPTTLGGTGGAESTTLTAAQIPSITSNVSVNVNVNVSGNSTRGDVAVGTFNYPLGTQGSVFVGPSTFEALGFTGSGSGSGTGTAASNNTSGAAHRVVQPTILTTYYLKL